MVRFALVPLAAISFACYSATESRTSTSPSSRTLITRAELERVGSVNLLDAVRTLRPLWLTPRAGTGRGFLLPDGPRLVVDNVPYGEYERLREFPFDQVIAIRFVSGIDATTQWGTGVPFGVIEVITTRRR